MTKPNPYCECDKWDQPAGICAYCHGYTDGWVERAALVAERDALRLALRTIRASGVGVAVDLASVALAGGPP